MGYLLVLGARSDIAKAVAHEFAQNGYNLYLAARESQLLNNFAKDLIVRYGIDVKCYDFDVLNYSSHQFFYRDLPEKPIGVISAIGYLGKQDVASLNFEELNKIVTTNYLGVISIFEIIAADFELNQSGFIIGISSVAGDRGRASNYLYGSAKSGLTTYLSGLRNRLYKSKVHVLTVKPGFVDTQMTKDMALPRMLTATPEKVSRDIFNALNKKKNTIYTINIWFVIMGIIRNLPEFIFKRMNL